MFNPIIFSSLFSSVIIPIKQGTIINNVHHPSKKILILVIPKAFKPNIIPIKIKTNPKTYLM